ncbi:hypothetical protein AQUCO_04900052v1 [Aquilegia coerulea]|uniref:AB hydrolase-1 domain-containing protein n=1 Tax=Aquilegia coerulea TaxID=218851 RepID=A0A2G5CJY3_AQUCA|nr:hypothetical protein AQUCO_04900052v1 [Aquilegia coerulea]PIA31480.1 hypothetical protein AQUCO_04900052v1 [Aquilegia coerulea]PIA31481.1 hypothetical protein AQUCO_04900052v1 [Aquilegia coerulea]PIA31482.1 hypothetical protein AQUCO_04900052v1 [Aquilegia coerulea]PIA31483.1 hypothetical protein AQUCO_04900052v1 [Aquilegia coerulea]
MFSLKVWMMLQVQKNHQREVNTENEAGHGMILYYELPHTTVHQIPGCGHLPHVEKPDHVAKLIRDFVRVHCALQH